MAVAAVSGFLNLFRRVDRLFETVEKTQNGVEKLADRLRLLENRMSALEAGQRDMVTEARAAAAVAAAGAVTTHLVDMSRRIGMLEAGAGDRKRLE